jgi:hypothetical protein
MNKKKDYYEIPIYLLWHPVVLVSVYAALAFSSPVFLFRGFGVSEFPAFMFLPFVFSAVAVVAQGLRIWKEKSRFDGKRQSRTMEAIGILLWATVLYWVFALLLCYLFAGIWMSLFYSD